MSDNRRHTCKLDACHGHIGPPCRQAKIGDNFDVDDGVDCGDGGIDDGGDGDGYDGGAPGLRAWASREIAGARVDDGEIRSQRWPAQDQACCREIIKRPKVSRHHQFRRQGAIGTNGTQKVSFFAKLHSIGKISCNLNHCCFCHISTKS